MGQVTRLGDQITSIYRDSKKWRKKGTGVGK